MLTSGRIRKKEVQRLEQTHIGKYGCTTRIREQLTHLGIHRLQIPLTSFQVPESIRTAKLSVNYINIANIYFEVSTLHIVIGYLLRMMHCDIVTSQYSRIVLVARRSRRAE